MENYITSSTGAGVKRVKKLASSRAFRMSEGVVIAEGERIIRDLPLEAQIQTLYLLREKKDKYAYLSERAQEVIYCSENVMRAMSDTSTPCGVLALVRRPSNVFSSGNAVIADGISDPGNLGTIVRTAAACGVKNVLAAGCCDAFSPKAVRASMGGVFRTAIVECPREEAVAHARDFKIFALDMRGENVYNIKKSEFSGRYALAVGSEAFGLSEQLKAAAFKCVSLPMAGEMESLNAAVSLAVALYTVEYALK